MTYRPPANWNRRLLEPYQPALPKIRDAARIQIQNALASGELKVISRGQCYCGGRSFVSISSHDRYGLPFGTKLCKKCGLIITDPMLDEATLPLYYNQFYHQICFGDIKKLAKQGLFGANQGQLIFDRLWESPTEKIKKHARVLEIGAGVGNVLNEFRDTAQKKGLEVSLLGTEYCSECIDIIREMSIEVIEGGCLEVLEKYDEPFDILILSHMLEHVTDIDLFMDGVIKLVSPETIIYIEVPGVLTLHTKPEYDFDFINYFTHAHSAHYNFETLKYHMRRFGLDCIVGNEIAYGIFKAKPEVMQNNLPPKIDAQMLFYLANMETTLGSSAKVMERILNSEARFNQEAKKTQDLNDQITQIRAETDNQKRQELTKQKQQLEQQAELQKLQSEQQKLQLEQQKLQLERQALQREQQKQTELAGQKQQMEQQKLAELTGQKQQLEQQKLAELAGQKQQLEQQKLAELAGQKQQLEQQKLAELAGQKQQLEQQKLTELAGQKQQLEQQKRAELAGQKELLQQLIDQANQEIQKKQQEVDRQINMRQRLKKSVSWRVTAPLRGLGRLLWKSEKK